MSHDDYVSSRMWNDLLIFNEKLIISKAYCKPVIYRDRDMQWRILHCASASRRQVRRTRNHDTDSSPLYDGSKHSVVVYCVRFQILSLHVSTVLKCRGQFD